MKKITNLILFAVAIFSLAACSDDNLVSVDNNATSSSSDKLPINFDVYTSSAKSTRAGVGGPIDTEKLKDYGFGVFAINTGTKTFEESYPDLKDISDDGGGNPLLSDVFNYMLNEKVSYQDGGWKCGTTKYWPNPTFEDANGPEKSQYVSFFAYAPYVERTEDNWDNTDNEDPSEGGILKFYTNQTYYSNTNTDNYIADPKVDYSMVPVKDANATSDNTLKQVDLLWGTAGNNGKSWDGNDQEGKNFGIFEPTINGVSGGNDDFNTGLKVNADLTKMTTNGSVSFNFKHALASVGGNVPNGTNPDNSFTIDAINDVVREDGSETNNDGSNRNNSTTGLKDDNRISVNWIVIEVKDKNSSGTSYTANMGVFDLINGEWQLVPSEDEENKNVYYVIGKKTDTDDSKKAIIKKGLGVDVTDNSSIVSVNMNDNICLTNDGATYESLIGDNNGTFTWLSNAKNGVTTTMQNPLVEGSEPFLFIPDYDGTPEITVAVDYDIVCPDKAFDDEDVESHKGYTIAHQMQKATVSFADKMKINTKYNLHLHLGVNSIKVDANVSDWGVSSQDVDLPANSK